MATIEIFVDREIDLHDAGKQSFTGGRQDETYRALIDSAKFNMPKRNRKRKPWELGPRFGNDKLKFFKLKPETSGISVIEHDVLPSVECVLPEPCGETDVANTIGRENGYETANVDDERHADVRIKEETLWDEYESHDRVVPNDVKTEPEWDGLVHSVMVIMEPDLNGVKTEPILNSVETKPDLNGVETEPDFNGVETKPDLNGVETEPDLEIELDLNGVETEPGLGSVETELDLNNVEIELILNDVETEPDFNGVETEPGLDGVETEPSLGDNGIEFSLGGMETEIDGDKREPEEKCEIQNDKPPSWSYRIKNVHPNPMAYTRELFRTKESNPKKYTSKLYRNEQPGPVKYTSKFYRVENVPSGPETNTSSKSCRTYSRVTPCTTIPRYDPGKQTHIQSTDLQNAHVQSTDDQSTNCNQLRLSIPRNDDINAEQFASEFDRMPNVEVPLDNESAVRVMEVSTSAEIVYYKCGQCDKVCKSRGGLKLHMKSHAPTVENVPSGTKTNTSSKLHKTYSRFPRHTTIRQHDPDEHTHVQSTNVQNSDDRSTDVQSTNSDQLLLIPINSNINADLTQSVEVPYDNDDDESDIQVIEVMTSANVARYRCVECNKECKSRGGLTLHMKSHPPTVKNAPSRPESDVSSNSRRTYSTFTPCTTISRYDADEQTHVQSTKVLSTDVQSTEDQSLNTNSNILKSLLIGINSNARQIPPETQIDESDVRAKEVSTSADAAYYKCGKCDQKYKSRVGLWVHMRSHAPTSKKTYSRVATTRQHDEQTHGQSRNVRSRNSNQLLLLIPIDDDDIDVDPTQSDVDDDDDELDIRAMEVSTSADVAYYKCGICDKEYKSSRGLSVHLTSHVPREQRRTTAENDVKRFLCGVCGVKFGTELRLRYHVQSAHAGVSFRKWEL